MLEHVPTALIEESIGWVERYGQELTREQIRRLLQVVENFGERDAGGELVGGSGEAIDLKAEIGQMMKMIRGVRRNVMSDGGTLKGNFDIRDAKDVIASSTTLLNLLVKSQNRVDEMDRVAAIEAATIEAVKSLPEGVQQEFFETLTERLGEAQV